jgi:hypothetical protein
VDGLTKHIDIPCHPHSLDPGLDGVQLDHQAADQNPLSRKHVREFGDARPQAAAVFVRRPEFNFNHRSA